MGDLEVYRPRNIPSKGDHSDAKKANYQIAVIYECPRENIKNLVMDKAIEERNPMWKAH